MTFIFLSSCNVGNSHPEPDFILLGERHGAKEHQLETAKYIAAQAKENKKLAIVMEMIDVDRAKLVKVFTQISPDNLKDFAYAIEWDKSGWPDFSLYRPIFENIWKYKIHIFAGDVSQNEHLRWRRERWMEEELDPTYKLELSAKERSAIIHSWKNSLQKSYCSNLSDATVAVRLNRKDFKRLKR